MNDDPQWIFAPLGAAILLPALIELRPLLARVRAAVRASPARSISPSRAGSPPAFTPAYSADRQQLFTIEYVWDETARTGRFAVNNDGAPVPYEADWERVEMPYTTRRRWAAPAPAVPVAAPTRDPGRAQDAARRHARLRLRLAPNGAESIALIAPPGAELRAAGSGAFLRRFGRGERGRQILSALRRPRLRRRRARHRDRRPRAGRVHHRRHAAPACRPPPRRWSAPGRRRPAAIWPRRDDRAGRIRSRLTRTIIAPAAGTSDG